MISNPALVATEFLIRATGNGITAFHAEFDFDQFIQGIGWLIGDKNTSGRLMLEEIPDKKTVQRPLMHADLFDYADLLGVTDFNCNLNNDGTWIDAV